MTYLVQQIPNLATILVCGIGVALSGIAALALYRIYFHPLSAFPGPILAAATGWYETYYDVYMKGKMAWRLEALHKRYGPVVRYGPNKLHFSDPAAYDAIYMDKKSQKVAHFYDAYLETDASFGYIDNKASKARRDMLRSFFSRKGVLKLESVVQDTVDRFIRSLAQKVGSPKPIHLHHAFSCVTLEVITTYCFAKRFEAIEYPDYAYPAIIALNSSMRQCCIGQHFPIFLTLLLSLPDWLLVKLSPNGLAYPNFCRELHEQVDQILRDPNSLDQAEHDTIYHHMLDPGSGHPQPSEKSLKEESQVLIGAGTDTAANACAHAAFYVLSNKQIKERLKQELVEAWPDPDTPMSLEKLEKLPYLSGVAHEALRFSHGVTSLLPRVLNQPTEIGGVLIPTGTIVHMGQMFVHRNPDIFPDPLTFRPERWMEKDSSDLLNYVVAFSKGPRNCIGINLAWAELFLILGNFFRKVDAEIVETTVEDLEFEAYLLPALKGSVKAVIHKVEGIEHIAQDWQKN